MTTAKKKRPDKVDNFIARNREALNASIRQSRKEIEQGIHSIRSMDDIIADGRRRNKPPVIQLSPEDGKAFVDALLDPAPPSKKLCDAFKRHRRLLKY